MANFDVEYWHACADSERAKNNLLVKENLRLIKINAELRAQVANLRVEVERQKETEQQP